MKKRVLFMALAIVFFTTTVVMSFMYNKERKNVDTFAKMSVLVIEGFANAVDYTLCLDDVLLGNTNFKSCENYLTRFVEETKILREDFGMETKYNYIGK